MNQELYVLEWTTVGVTIYLPVADMALARTPGFSLFFPTRCCMWPAAAVDENIRDGDEFRPMAAPKSACAVACKKHSAHKQPTNDRSDALWALCAWSQIWDFAL